MAYIAQDLKTCAGLVVVAFSSKNPLVDVIDGVGRQVRGPTWRS